MPYTLNDTESEIVVRLLDDESQRNGSPRAELIALRDHIVEAENGEAVLDIVELDISRPGAMELARRYLGTCRTTGGPAPVEFAGELRDALADMIDEFGERPATSVRVARLLLNRIRDRGM